jgi:hypothetical protein
MKKLKKEKSYKLQAPSNKQQATSLTMDLRYCRMVLMTSFGVFPVDKFAKAPQQWRKQ